MIKEEVIVLKKLIFGILLFCFCFNVKADEIKEILQDESYFIKRGTSSILEFNKMLKDDRGMPVFYLQFDGSEKSLTEKQKEEINLIINYNLSSAEKFKDYVSTQYLIFMYVHNSQSFSLTDSEGNKLGVYYNKITSILEDHYKKPSYDGMVIEGNLGETFQVKDDNKMSSRYTTVSSDGLLVVKERSLINVTINDFGLNK